MDPVAIGEGLAILGAALVAWGLMMQDMRRLRLLALLGAVCGGAAAALLQGRIAAATAAELALAAMGLAALGATLGLARGAWTASPLSIRSRDRPPARRPSSRGCDPIRSPGACRRQRRARRHPCHR